MIIINHYIAALTAIGNMYTFGFFSLKKIAHVHCIIAVIEEIARALLPFVRINYPYFIPHVQGAPSPLTT